MNRDGSIYSTWFYGGALLLVLIGAAGGLYLALSSYFARGELGTKAAYAVLQGIELDSRGNPGPGPIFKENVNGSGLNALGIASGGASSAKVWMILNQLSPEGRPLIMPLEIPGKVDCTHVREVISGQQVVNPVRQYLLKICTHY